MQPEQIGKLIADRFGAAILEARLDAPQPWVNVAPGHLVEILAFLRDRPETKFDYLRAIAGVDYIQENEFELVYFLFSYPHRHDLKVKVRISREVARIATAEGVWPAANWHEREIFDLLGIEFEGHSDMRRILLPDDWVGYPLRKDYKEQAEYHGVSTTRPYPTGMPELPTLPPNPAPVRK
ncbi:MAG: NADH-quinone oxidoreductase subunit C [Pseudomonadota bacterium]